MSWVRDKNKYCLAALVFLIVPLSGVSIDLYVPSLPAVGHYFHTSKKWAQLTITAYLLGLGLLQLFAGSISDSFGRKKPFMLAMVIYIATAFLMPYTHTIQHLIALRFLQGASLALAVVPMRSVILDLFVGDELQKMMTYMTMSWSLGPIIAPALGGYLQYYWGWKANFYFLGLYSLSTLVLALFFLFETSPHRHPLGVSPILRRYASLLRQREYVHCIVTGGLLFSLITLFGIMGPFFIQTVMHYTAIQFGRLTLCMGLAWFLGAMTNRFLLQTSLSVKAKMCFTCMLATVLLMFGVALFQPMSIYLLMIPMLCLFYCSGILYPSYFIHSVLLFRKISASANALYNSSAFFIAGLISGLSTFLRVNTMLPFIAVLIALVGCCCFLYYWDNRTAVMHKKIIFN